MDERESDLRRIQLGMIRSLNASIIRDFGPDISDESLLATFGDSSRPLAEALYDVMVELVNRSRAHG